MYIQADDPCAVVRGGLRTRVRIVATVLMLWRVMGYSLAYHKGQLGRELSWIGYQMKLTGGFVQVAVEYSFIKELLDSTRKLNKVNSIRVRDLGRLTRKANHISVVCSPGGPSWTRSGPP